MPGLFRYSPALTAALFALAWTAAAAAQTTTAGSLVVRTNSVGGEDVPLGTIQIGIDDCNNHAAIEFEIDGVPDNRESVDVYTGEACNETNRTDNTSNKCEYIGNFKAGVSRGLLIDIPADQLIGDCSAGVESTPKIWFLAVMTPGGSEDVGNYYKAIDNIRLDTRRPDPPTEVSGGSGEKQIPVSWSSSDTDLDGFVVLIDPAPTMGGTAGAGSGSAMSDEDGGTVPISGGSSSEGCGSTVLTPGGSSSDLPSRIKRKEVNKATSSGVDLSPGDIDGNSAAISVIAVDLAGNESVMSAIACVEVVPTESFWDRYQQEPDAVDHGCPCTAVGPAQLQSAWPVGLSLALCALSARRRRRS